MNSPINGKPMIIMQTPEVVRYKGVDVRFMHLYWLCEESGEQFTDNEMDEYNLAEIKHEYDTAIMEYDKPQEIKSGNVNISTEKEGWYVIKYHMKEEKLYTKEDMEAAYNEGYNYSQDYDGIDGTLTFEEFMEEYNKPNPLNNI